MSSSGELVSLVRFRIHKAILRGDIDPFAERYESFIIAGLLVFDMLRMMGRGEKYAVDGFRSRLRAKMRTIRPAIGDLIGSSLHDIDLVAHARAIEAAYDPVAAAETQAYGLKKFMRIEPATPLARLFDKAAWVAG